MNQSPPAYYDRLDMRERFRQTAMDLGVLSEDDEYLRSFDFTVGRDPIRVELEESKGNVVAIVVTFCGTVGGAKGDLPLIVVRAEDQLDRMGKAVGVNREVQLGDPEVDAKVYFETEASEADVRHVLAEPASRKMLVELVSKGFAVLIGMGGWGSLAVRSPPTEMLVHPDAMKAVAASLVTLGQSLQRVRKPQKDPRENKRIVRKASDGKSKGVWALISSGLLVTWGTMFGWAFLPGTALIHPYLVILVLCVALTAAGVWALVRMLRGRHDSLGSILGLSALWALCSVAFALFVPHALNRLLDSAPANEEQAHFVSVSRGKQTSSRLRLDSGPYEGVTFSLPGDYSSSPTTKVKVHNGVFGWPWITLSDSR